ncbi:hypothetical protein GOBAR_DD23837 [Gossypium barbadense]|nr:hypothetical protein GOBAR_DD23837 [Gossypium barbadense]
MNEVLVASQNALVNLVAEVDGLLDDKMLVILTSGNRAARARRGLGIVERGVAWEWRYAKGDLVIAVGVCSGSRVLGVRLGSLGCFSPLGEVVGSATGLMSSVKVGIYRSEHDKRMTPSIDELVHIARKECEGWLLFGHARPMMGCPEWILPSDFDGPVNCANGYFITKLWCFQMRTQLAKGQVTVNTEEFSLMLLQQIKSKTFLA